MSFLKIGAVTVILGGMTTYIPVASIFLGQFQVEFCLEDLHIMLFYEIGYSECHTLNNSINESLPHLLWILHLI
jgi:hypothetical protein